jgi:hypothetical protein
MGKIFKFERLKDVLARGGIALATFETQQTADFVASGGKITKIPMGRSGKKTPPKVEPLTRKHVQNLPVELRKKLNIKR